MAPDFLTVTWHREDFPGLGVQGVKGLILDGALSLLDRGMKREEKKKTMAMGKEGFPRAGHALLAVQWVAAVKCN
jgi:hypothetical protein